MSRMFPIPGKSPKFIEHEGALIGVCLGADATTEHECGIELLRSDFGARRVPCHHGSLSFKSDFNMWKGDVEGQSFFNKALRRKIPLPPMGLAKRKIQTVPANLQWMKAKNGREGFGYTDRNGFDQFYVDHFAAQGDTDDLVAGWSNGAFYVLAATDLDKERLHTIYENFVNKNAAIIIAQGFIIATGLCLMIADRLPEEITEDWQKSDEAAFNSEKALEETGIAEFLTGKGKKWHSMSSYGEDPDGMWRVLLNPTDNGAYGKHNRGRYTIAQLRQWADDKGPVMRENTHATKKTNRTISKVSRKESRKSLKTSKRAKRKRKR